MLAAKALDDYTLQVTFTTPAVYNLNIIGMWVAHAMPKWIIEERGDRWTEAGFNQSYGPYALKEWVHDSYITIVKNPFWPGIESSPQASIEEIKFTMLDASPAFAEYEAGNLDVAGVPLQDVDCGSQAIRTYPPQAILPALALSITMFAFNFLGDGLRDALDPRLRGTQ